MFQEQNQFGKELRRLRLRKDARYTQEQLSKLAGISGAYISQLETGKKKPTDRVITKLSDALKINENRLLIIVGKIKMDLAGTLAINRSEATEVLTKLSDEEWKELLTYLAYVKVRASIISK